MFLAFKIRNKKKATHKGRQEEENIITLSNKLRTELQ